MIVAGFILALAGIIFLIAGAGQVVQNRAFRDAQTTKGTVIHKRSHQTKIGREYLLMLSYSVDGIAYEREVGVQASEYDNIELGEQFEVQYRPSNPKKILRPQDTNPKIVKVFLILGAVMLVVGVALLFIRRMIGLQAR